MKYNIEKINEIGKLLAQILQARAQHEPFETIPAMSNWRDSNVRVIIQNSGQRLVIHSSMGFKFMARRIKADFRFLIGDF